MFNWTERSIDRGLSWICYHGGNVVGGIAFSYLPANNGAMFSRNRGSGHVSVIVRHNDVVLMTRSLSARTRNETDKLVRSLIREEGLRRKVESAQLACAIQ